MKQQIDKSGNFSVSLFYITDQRDEDKFIYFYLALDRPVKKIIENAFYKAYMEKLLKRAHPEIIHTEENGVVQIEVHPKDILENIEIIKKIIFNSSDEKEKTTVL